MPKFVLANDFSNRKPEPTPPATRAKTLSRSQIARNSKGGKTRAVLSDDVQKKICELYGKMWKTRSHSWRCGEVVRLAASERLTRIDGDPITKRNVSDYIHRTSKP